MENSTAETTSPTVAWFTPDVLPPQHKEYPNTSIDVVVYLKVPFENYVLFGFYDFAREEWYARKSMDFEELSERTFKWTYCPEINQ